MSRRWTTAVVLAAGLCTLASVSAADIFVYPKPGQSQQQFQQDQFDCHGWAKQQTGFDPAQHLDVRVGEDSFVIGHRRKSERAPQTAGLLEVDARLRRHLGPGELRVTEKGACE